MSTLELRKRLIDKIQKTENISLLREAYRLLGIEDEDPEAYKLTEQQKNIVNEAREEVKKGNFMTDDEANNAIDEWLEK